jgi:poly-gamma-glutamate synthesis protein (capsule biosynthesis protein)
MTEMVLTRAPGNGRRVSQRASRLALVAAVAGICGGALPASLVCAQSSGASKGAKTAADFVITLTGDSIIMVPTLGDQNNARFTAVANAIREGDAAFTNLEVVFPSSKAFPSAISPASYLGAPPAMLGELQVMGFNLFSLGNNHAYDYGIQGLLDTIEVMRQNNAIFAGVGETLGRARAAGYLDTKRGRVALVSAASSIDEQWIAGDPRPDAAGRPGLNPLHFQTTLRVDPATFDTLSSLRGKAGIVDSIGPVANGARVPGGPAPADRPDIISVAGRTYERSDQPGVLTNVSPKDMQGIGASIKDAKRRANYVVTSLHAHESGDRGLKSAPQFEEEFARASIDAGADVFVAHGPHLLRGIEIYKGRPIFYSLGGLFFQSELTPVQPSDFYNRINLGPEARPSEGFSSRGSYFHDPDMYETVVARVNFRAGSPAEIVLTPVQLRLPSAPLPQYGTPELATPTQAAKILRDLQTLSEPYHTTINIRGSIGYITVPTNAK